MNEQKKIIEVLFNAFGTKDVTEAVFKNLTWFIACGTLLRLIPLALSSGRFAFALMAFLVLVFLLVINFRYGAENILVPVDAAVGKHLSIVQVQNQDPNQTNAERAKRLSAFLFGTKFGIGYLLISLAYVWFIFELIGMVARALGRK